MSAMPKSPGYGLAMLPMLAAILIMASAQPAGAGGYRLEPGAATRIDTGERQAYTTITVSNPDAMPGQLTLDAPVSRIIDVPARGQLELYGTYGTGTVGVTNTGSTRLEIVTRYMERPRWP